MKKISISFVKNIFQLKFIELINKPKLFKLIIHALLFVYPNVLREQPTRTTPFKAPKILKHFNDRV